MPPHGQGTHHVTRPQVAKVDRAVCIRTSVHSLMPVSLHSSIVRVGTPTLAWLTQCSEICTELGERVQSVAKLIAKFSAANDHDSCVSLRTCSVVCLSNLAELYHILSHHPLWKLPKVAMLQYERTMYHMSDISKELMNDDDIRHLPSYAGVSIADTYRHVLWIDVIGFLTVLLGPHRNASSSGSGHDVIRRVHPSP